jgi:hypothetical protein
VWDDCARRLSASLVAAKTRRQHCLCREVDEIWKYRMGRNLTIFDKDHDTVGSRRFLQPSIQLRYNYYIQLVATKRDWVRVPNLKWTPVKGHPLIDMRTPPDYPPNAPRASSWPSRAQCRLRAQRKSTLHTNFTYAQPCISLIT